MHANPQDGAVRILGAVRNLAPDRRTVRADAVAGLPGAIASVPDGMAASVLAGVNPVHGLYASFAGPIAGGLTASSRLMLITTTSAAALAAGSALESVDPADRTGALFLLTLLAGMVMLAAGALKLGRYTRFVPHSVMIGFLTGVAVNIVCGQLADLTGTTAEGGTSVAKAFDVLVHPGRIEWAALLSGLAAIGLLVGLARTRLASIGALIALVVPSAAVVLFGLDQVLRVEDGGAIPVGIPFPAVPDLRYLSVSLVTGAGAIAVLVLVQGAGVSEAAPNPSGRTADANVDFAAQGAGNVASAFFQGLPVGGSVGQTAINVAAGARSRWASIFSGLWMVLILLVLSEVVGKVALPTLAAVLIVAGIGSVRPGEVRAILRTGSTSAVALITTFVATLILPVAVAVGVGVALSLLMQLNREAIDLRVVQLEPLPDGGFTEALPGERLRSDAVTVLDVYGSLLYAGSRTLQARLPDPVGTTRPVVVLRMRGRTTLGATFFVVLSDYAHKLAQQGGHLYVSGTDPILVEQMRRNGKVEVDGPVTVFPAEPVIGASTLAAVEAGHTFLVEHADPRTEPDHGEGEEEG